MCAGPAHVSQSLAGAILPYRLIIVYASRDDGEDRKAGQQIFQSAYRVKSKRSGGVLGIEGFHSGQKRVALS